MATVHPIALTFSPRQSKGGLAERDRRGRRRVNDGLLYEVFEVL